MLDPLPDHLASRIGAAMSSSTSPSSSSSSPSASQSGSCQALSASDPNTWPEPVRPPSPLPSPSSLQSTSAVSMSSISSSPSLHARPALDPALLQSAVRSWLDEHGAAIIHDWLTAHSDSLLLQRSRSGGDSARRSDSSTRMEDVDDHPADHRSLGISPRRSSPLASSSTASALPPSPSMSSGEGDEFEVDPRKMLASRNRQRISDMQQGQLGLGSIGSSSSSSSSFSQQQQQQQLHTSAVDRIKDSPLAEEGATAQELHKQPLHIRPQSGGSKPSRGGSGAGSSGGGSGPEVLLVEDNRVSQKIAQQALTRAHYKVEVASDGETAMEKYRQHAGSLRIVLMDVGLPGISGTEAVERIRKLQHDAGHDDILIYGLTGNVAEANLRQYEQAGMNGCIVKGKLLVDAVKQAVEMSERNPHEFVNLSGTAVRPTAAAAAAEDEQMTDAGAAAGPLASPRSATDAPVFRPAPRASPTHAASPPSSLVSPTATSAAAAAAAAAAASPPSSSPPTAARPSYQPGSSSGPDLLLVEDVRVSQRVAQAALQRVQFRVEVASDGESAVDKYRQLHSSLRIILMDVGLPGISGIEATEIIRAQEREYGVQPADAVLIFGLTGNVEQENLREYEQVGMNGCIVKGRLIGDAVKQAIEETSRRPGQFINLVGKADSTAAAAPASPQTTPRSEAAAAAAASPSSPLSMSGVSPTLPDDDDIIVAPSDRAAALRNASASASADTIGTPRAIYPRQLLRERFPGSGVTRAGVGLPGAGAGGPAGAGGGGGGGGGLGLGLGSGGGSPTGGLSTPSLTSASGGLGVRSTSGGHHGPDVLLVEDVRVSQKIAQQALTRQHYKVEVASDGETAVEKYRQHASSLRIVLMDVGLPGISGIEATERIRAMEAARLDRGDDDSGRPVWIFGLTGNVAESNLRQYEQAGMNGCIVKGQLLVDAVKLAVERVERDEKQFVNLSAADSAGVRNR